MPDESGGGIFTGERLVADDPLFAADIARHLVAYRFAQERAAAKSVLDAGCGDGYGTHLLAASAASALGVDRNQGTIDVARRRYPAPNLRYQVCQLDALSGLGESFDLVCNFQVLEHLPEPLPFLEQARAVLRPGGTFILTTPNRAMTEIEIPYHVHEYLADELAALLGRVFPKVEVQGVSPDPQAMAYEVARVQSAKRILRLDPLNLRRLVPQGLIELVYPHLAKLVRRSVRDQGVGAAITVDNFRVSSDCSQALDLLAICRA